MTAEVYDLQPNPLSPEWWVNRLYKQLGANAEEIQFYDDYYVGDHPLPWLAPQARDEFRRILLMTRSNYMGLVCDATVERCNVEGFRLGGEEAADDVSWGIWQANHMDVDSDLAWLESTVGGCSYFMTERNPNDATKPYISVEHGSQAVTESVPGRRRERHAGLKVWVDDWTGKLNATLFLMDQGQLYVLKYQAREQADRSGSKPVWQRRPEPDGEWGLNGQFDRIPLVPIENNPRLLTGGRSELEDLTDIQDRINKTLADRLITQDFGAFSQKWASAWPNEDDEGNPNTIDIGRDRMITTDVKETKFGQFDASPIDPYSAAKKEDVHDIAARSRTPAQYLLGEMSNVNGETLKASESGLVSKVRERMKVWGEAAEETMRMARALAGIDDDPDVAARMETIWKNPEFRTEAEVTDAAIKRRQAGITPLRQTREDIGYSQTAIANMETQDRTELVAPIIQQALRAGDTGGSAQPPVGG